MCCKYPNNSLLFEFEEKYSNDVDPPVNVLDLLSINGLTDVDPGVIENLLWFKVNLSTPLLLSTVLVLYEKYLSES